MKSPVLGKVPVFFNVDGVPVSAVPTNGGGTSVRAFDDPAGRPARLSWAMDEGAVISAEEFKRLKAELHAS